METEARFVKHNIFTQRLFLEHFIQQLRSPYFELKGQFWWRRRNPHLPVSHKNEGKRAKKVSNKYWNVLFCAMPHEGPWWKLNFVTCLRNWWGQPGFVFNRTEKERKMVFCLYSVSKNLYWLLSPPHSSPPPAVCSPLHLWHLVPSKHAQESAQLWEGNQKQQGRALEGKVLAEVSCKASHSQAGSLVPGHNRDPPVWGRQGLPCLGEAGGVQPAQHHSQASNQTQAGEEWSVSWVTIVIWC